MSTSKLSRAIALGLLSAAIVFALFRVLLMDARLSGAGPIVEANERNIVDVVASFRLDTRVRSVELNHSILSIDLELPGKLPPEAVFKDLYRIGQTAIGGTTNLNEVLVRLFDPSGAGRTASSPPAGRGGLMLGVDLTRKGWKGLEGRNYDNNSNLYRTDIERHFRIVYTPRWAERSGEH